LSDAVIWKRTKSGATTREQTASNHTNPSDRDPPAHDRRLNSYNETLAGHAHGMGDGVTMLLLDSVTNRIRAHALLEGGGNASTTALT
jgi:hypothetical protein